MAFCFTFWFAADTKTTQIEEKLSSSYLSTHLWEDVPNGVGNTFLQVEILNQDQI